MVRPGRPKDHVHNWKLKISEFDPEFSQNEQGWYGFYATRVWECIRGNKVKHISPSKDYPAIVVDFEGKSIELEPRVFLAMSGSPYIVEDPY